MVGLMKGVNAEIATLLSFLNYVGRTNLGEPTRPSEEKLGADFALYPPFIKPTIYIYRLGAKTYDAVM